MLIDRVNLNHLRMFESVYRTQSMTQAAEELHLTQSGISQHMKALEDSLSIKLFDRVRQKLIPTQDAATLYQKCREGLYNIEETLSDLKGTKKELSGQVTIGMPIEFGHNCVLPIILDLAKKHPLLKFDIRFGYAYEMNNLILNGQLDFAFVDSFGFDRRISLAPVYEEVLLLCAAKEYLKKKGAVREEKEFFESLDYIEYLKGAPVLNMWFGHHFPNKHFIWNTKATIMDVWGVAKMILSGLGAGVIPSHHLTSPHFNRISGKNKTIHLFRGCGKPLTNTISVAYLRERTHSPTTMTVLNWVMSSLKNH